VTQLDLIGVLRVLRGGAVWLEAGLLRSAVRGRPEPGARGDDIGFRVVRRPRRQYSVC
jgi:formylglycine-generating enzyme required for sulfatase activity